MSELNLQINYDEQSHFMNIDKKSTFKFLCNMIRSIFKKEKPEINNKKLIVFNGIPPKKLFEHEINSENSLEQLIIYNNSILRVSLDEDNYYIEEQEKSRENLQVQKPELNKYQEYKNFEESKDKIKKESYYDNSRNPISNEEKNISKEVPILTTQYYGKNKIFRKIIPADNSCIFTSINYCVYGSMGDPMMLRELICGRILNDTDYYNEAILEKTPEDYCNWILDKNSWGGGIELSIIPYILSVKIGVVSIRDLKIEYFGEEFDNVIYVIYSGIHYDSIMKQTEKGEVGIFFKNDESIIEDILEMAKDLKNKKDFVDMKKYKLKCDICYCPLEGNNEAIEHGKKTGHANFVQYD